MAHYTLIGGTAKSIIGGKTLIDGTEKTIVSGKTLIGGTAKDIVFGGPTPTIEQLMGDATLAKIQGRNASTGATISISNENVPSGLSYLFSICNGYSTIYKVKKTDASSNPILTIIKQMSSSTGNALVTSAGALNYSATGEGGSSSRATLVLLQFNSYTERQADNCFSALTLTRGAGRNSSSTGAVRVSSGWPAYFMGAYGAFFEFAYVTTPTNITVIYKNTQTAILVNSNNLLALYTNVYGGSIISVS